MQRSRISSRFRRNVLSSALLVATGTGLATNFVHAQDVQQSAAGSAAMQTRKFDIAAQPAEAALNMFASQADITLIFSSELVSGIRINRIAGTYDVRDALSRMLEGTGLSYSQIGNATIAINKNEPNAAKPAGAMPQPAYASSSVGVDDDVTEIGGVRVEGQYIGERASGARFEVPLKNVPYSITTYTSEFMEEIDATRTADLYRYMTGISRAQRNGFGIAIRGFTSQAADRNALLIDGMPGVVGRAGSPPTVGIDRVEVFRGPSSILYGRASPGGFVNLVSKKPQSTKSTQIEYSASTYAGSGLSFGSKFSHGLSLDMTGPLNDSATLMYRFVGEAYDDESFRDYSEENAFYLAPSLTWAPSDRTKLTFGIEYHKERSSADSFLAAPGYDIRNVADIRTRYQEPGDYSKEETLAYKVDFEHAFSDQLRLDVKARSVDYDELSFSHSSSSIRPDNRTIRRQQGYQHNTRNFDFIDGALHWTYRLFGQESSVIVGASFGTEKSNFDRIQYYTSPAVGNPNNFDINIYAPVYGRVPNVPASPDTNRFAKVDVTAFYFNSLMPLGEKWKWMLGARYDQEDDNNYETRRGNPPTAKKSQKVSPSTGIVYAPSENVSYYVSYSTSFRPPSSSAVDINGQNTFDPEVGKQLEAGIKFSAFDGMLDSTFSLYRIRRENGLVSGATTGYFVQTGTEESKGAEFEVNAHLSDEFRFTAGYAYNRAEVTSDTDPLTVGASLTNTPRNSAHVWARYDMPMGSRLDGFGMGAGLVYAGERIATTRSTATPDVLVLPSYLTMDTAFYYGFGKSQVTLKINNVFDRLHYTSARNTVLVNPGDPRNVSLTYRYTF